MKAGAGLGAPLRVPTSCPQSRPQQASGWVFILLDPVQISNAANSKGPTRDHPVWFLFGLSPIQTQLLSPAACANQKRHQHPRQAKPDASWRFFIAFATPFDSSRPIAGPLASSIACPAQLNRHEVTAETDKELRHTHIFARKHRLMRNSCSVVDTLA
jgi:hypothetical protein